MLDRRDEGPFRAVRQTNKAGLTLNRSASACAPGLMPRLPLMTSEIVATGKLVCEQSSACVSPFSSRR